MSFGEQLKDSYCTTRRNKVVEVANELKSIVDSSATQMEQNANNGKNSYLLKRNYNSFPFSNKSNKSEQCKILKNAVAWLDEERYKDLQFEYKEPNNSIFCTATAKW